MFLIFDTETTGFLIRNRPLQNKNQPHLVELGAALCDKHGEIVDKMNMIAKPNRYEIPVGASNVHKITTEVAHDIGVPLYDILKRFDTFVRRATYLVCHNIEFDYSVLLANYYKEELRNSEMYKTFVEKETYCTMSDADVVNWCALPPTAKMLKYGRNHYKTPNLTELYIKCFGESFGDAHNAFADAKATSEVFFYMMKKGIIQQNFALLTDQV